MSIILLLILHFAFPTLRLPIITPNKRIPRRILAMPPRKVHSTLYCIIDKFRALNKLWRNPLLHPVHHRRKNIVLRIKRDTSLRRVPTLTQHPRPWPRAAMEHARDTEETRPFIHLCVRAVTANVLIKPVGIEGRNLVVLLAVVHEQLPAVLSEAR